MGGTNETRWDPPPGMAAAAPMNPMGGAPGAAPGGFSGAPAGFSQPGMAPAPMQAAAPVAQRQDSCHLVGSLQLILQARRHTILIVLPMRRSGSSQHERSLLKISTTLNT